MTLAAPRSRRIPVATLAARHPLAKLLLTVAVTWLILRGAGVELAEAWRVDWSAVQVSLPFIALSTIVLASTYAIQAVVWSGALVALGAPSVPVARGAAMLLVANLGRYVPGKVLQLLGLAALARRDGIPGPSAAVAAVATQVLHLCAALVAGGWVALESGVAEGIGRSAAIVAGTLAVLAAVGALYLGGAGALTAWALRRFGRGDAAVPPDSGSRIVRWLPGHIVNWMAHGTAFWCLARGLGIAIPLWHATAAFAAAYFAGYVAVFAPAGIGVREVSLVAFLAPVLGPAPAALLAAAQRVWITTVELGFALPAGALLRRAGPTGDQSPAPGPQPRSAASGAASGTASPAHAATSGDQS